MSDAVDPIPPTPETPPPAAPPPAATASPSRSIPAWSSLDAGARAVVGLGLGAVAILVIGGLLGAWPSTEFMVIALLAAVVAVGATLMGASLPASITGVAPATIITSLASAVVAVLGIMRFIELLADLNELDEVGGVVGAAAIVLLAIVGGALLFAAHRRDTATEAAVRANDDRAQLALFGLLLVLLGWGINLASYWTMRQATLSLVLLTLAALIIVLAGRGLPVMAAWAGIVLAAVAGLLALDQWGQLSRLGDTRLELGVTDYLPFIVYVAGLVLIIAAGARTVMATRPDAGPKT